MGARCVIAPGRNEAVLADLERRFGGRIRTLKLTGDEDTDREQMKRISPAPIDCALDILPPGVDTKAVRAAIMTVRPYGRVVLMGGVGMSGGPGLELPYPWIMRNCMTIRGVWMYPPDATVRLVGLVRAGLLRLEEFEQTVFPLDRVKEAVAHAASDAAPFKMTILQP
jgi:alcohol dehydrogenase